MRFRDCNGGVNGGTRVTRKLVAVSTLVCSRPSAAHVARANDTSRTFNLGLDVEVDLEFFNATSWNVDGSPACRAWKRTRPLLPTTDKLLEAAETESVETGEQSW